ncbi:uncharacterized protein LOC126551163 [Aphis gossypii]|uniref:uncharacterized protein LOC126551163 n=1 Tax=Aphis gossypii TaxID=80765 RepID=UPI002158CBF4|nr:uncharacterized protein LOC126551163 [Aphis gossypii]
MTSNKVLITIILIFFKIYNAFAILAVNRDPPIKICDDSVNEDGCDEKLYTDTASQQDDHEPLLNRASQNLNEKITNESINKESKSEICNHSVNKLGRKKKKENTDPLPGDLPDDRQLFLNHALQELNNNIKKDNDERKKEDPLLCDDSVNKDEQFYTDTGSLPAYINEYCDDLIKIKYNVPFRTPLQYCEYLYEQRKLRIVF